MRVELEYGLFWVSNIASSDVAIEIYIYKLWCKEMIRFINTNQVWVNQ